MSVDLPPRYQPRRVLGRGGMGEVVEAHDLQLDRRVAVKHLTASSAEDRLVERFQREARVLAEVAHPRVVRVFDSGFHQGRPFLVMEVLEGEVLSDRLRAGPLPPGEVRGLLDAVLEGLAHVHERGVLHRDLAPSNVFLAAGRGPVLIDFGLGRPREDHEALTRTGVVMGQLRSLAPEVLKGAESSVASDLFAVGRIGYEALTDVDMFTGRGRSALANEDVLSGLISGSYQATLWREMRAFGELGKLVARAMARRPRDRFESAAAMLAEVRRLPGEGAAPVPGVDASTWDGSTQEVRPPALRPALRAGGTSRSRTAAGAAAARGRAGPSPRALAGAAAALGLSLVGGWLSVGSPRAGEGSPRPSASRGQPTEGVAPGGVAAAEPARPWWPRLAAPPLLSSAADRAGTHAELEADEPVEALFERLAERVAPLREAQDPRRSAEARARQITQVREAATRDLAASGASRLRARAGGRGPLGLIPTAGFDLVALATYRRLAYAEALAALARPGGELIAEARGLFPPELRPGSTPDPRAEVFAVSLEDGYPLRVAAPGEDELARALEVGALTRGLRKVRVTLPAWIGSAQAWLVLRGPPVTSADRPKVALQIDRRFTVLLAAPRGRRGWASTSLPGYLLRPGEQELRLEWISLEDPDRVLEGLERLEVHALAGSTAAPGAPAARSSSADS